MKDHKKVIIVDDDPYFLQSTTERLVDYGFDVITASNMSEAKGVIVEHPDADAVVLDIMMPSGDESNFETQMGYKSGLLVARWVKQSFPNMAIIGISGVRSLDTMEWFSENNIPFFEKGSGEFVDGLNRILSVSKEDSLKNVTTFIVHGQDEVTKHELKNYLQNTLNLPEPLILHEQPSLGRTIIEKFEDTANYVNLVFVLLTPDDIAYDPSAPNDLRRRARQNVVFEMGYFFGKLHRRKGKVILLFKGQLELPSDISGIIYIDISNGIASAGELIRKELSFIL